MKLLLVAATSAEVQPLVSRLSVGSLSPSHASIEYGHHQIDVLVTGVGMVATGVACARVLNSRRPDLAINLGVCGSFTSAHPPGSVVHVTSDRFSELGAEDGDAFLTLQQLGLLGDDDPPFSGGRLVNLAPPAAVGHLPVVHGITVNTVHGNAPSIQRVVERWSPDVESMEGAAFMYACLVDGVAFAQVRAVSNRVERRNRESWKMADAMTALTNELAGVIGAL